AGQTGILPPGTLDDAPTAPAAPSGETPSSNQLLAGRDVSALSPSQLDSELQDTTAWLAEHPIALDRPEKEAYYEALRAAWQHAHPVPAAGTIESSSIIGISSRPVPFMADPFTAALIDAARGHAIPGAAPISGAQVMGSEFFGGQSWIYTFPSTRALPIDWSL